MISRERAEEIVRQAQEITVCGPWSDNMTKVMTEEEDAEVKLHWSALPGDTCYMDAFNDFRYDRLGEAG
jgi:hypothetical protein